METITADVKTGKPLKVVGTVKVPIYQSLVELQEAEKEERILGMFNKQNKIRIMGNERAKHQLGRIGKNKRFEIGFELLADVVDDDVLRSCIGNYEKLTETIESAEVQAAIDKYIAAQATDEDGDEAETEEATE